MNKVARQLVGLICLAGMIGCAQVPKQSVELSETVGRDLAELHRSHRDLANLLYDRMERDVNRFIDNVYVPFQVERTLKEHQAELTGAIEAAGRPDSTGERQSTAVAMMSIFLEELHAEVEDYRTKKLRPLREQRQQLVKSIDDAYTRVREANSVTTGYLSSVAKVHQAQSELLERFGMPDFQARVVKRATDLSEKLDDLSKKVKSGESKIDAAVKQLDEFVDAQAKSEAK
jgi:hypothetical protein